MRACTSACGSTVSVLTKKKSFAWVPLRRSAAPPPPPPAPGRTCGTREEATLDRAGEGGDLDAGVVVAGALRDVRVVGGGERTHRLAVVARAHPRSLERGNHARAHGIRDGERQLHLAEVVPHANPRAVGETARPRIVRMHLERRSGVARRQATKGRGRALVRRWGDQGERIGRLVSAEAGQGRSVAIAEI